MKRLKREIKYHHRVLEMEAECYTHVRDRASCEVLKSAYLTVLENRDHAALERFRNVGLSSVSRDSNWNQTSSNIGLVKI